MPTYTSNEMGGDAAELGVKEELLEEESGFTPNPTSFRGRLNLDEYTFSPKLIVNSPSTSPAPRRSPRRATDSPQPANLSNKRKSTHLPASKSPSPSKKPRPSSSYVPPETYAHLPPLPDVIAPNLLVLFIGLNPGLQTSIQGHAYAHPSNLFWKLLHSSGCTTRRMRAQEDRSLPELYSLGNTNIVARPTRNGAELSKAEMDANVNILEEKIRRFRPEAACVVGKSIWESIWRVRYGRAIRKAEFRYGWQNERENMGVVGGKDGECWEGARVFVATSTSGLAATLLPAEKEKIWRELGVWVEQRRAERATVGAVDDTHDMNKRLVK